MTLEGDSLVLRGLAVHPGDVDIDVRAVDQNESDLRAGTAFGEATTEVESVSIRVPLVAALADRDAPRPGGSRGPAGPRAVRPAPRRLHLRPGGADRR